MEIRPHTGLLVLILVRTSKASGRSIRSRTLFYPLACHKSAYVDWPADLIGLEDPSQAPFYWEIVPVRKTDLQNKCFKEPKAEENETARHRPNSETSSTIDCSGR